MQKEIVGTKLMSMETGLSCGNTCKRSF